MQYLLATNSIEIIAGDFSNDLLKVSQNKFLDIFTDHVHIVNKLNCYMNENSFLVFTIILVTASPTTPVIYSLKFFVFNSMGIDFLKFSSGHCFENQPVLGLGVR